MNVCERLHPCEVILPGVHVTLTGPHSFDAVTACEHVGNEVGLHPKAPPAGTPANTGAVVTVQVYVAVADALNPHDSAE